MYYPHFGTWQKGHELTFLRQEIPKFGLAFWEKNTELVAVLCHYHPCGRYKASGVAVCLRCS